MTSRYENGLVKLAEIDGEAGQKVIDSLLHIPAHREQPFRLNVNTYSVST